MSTVFEQVGETPDDRQDGQHHQHGQPDQRELRTRPAELLDQMGREDAVGVGEERQAGARAQARRRERPDVPAKLTQISRHAARRH